MPSHTCKCGQPGTIEMVGAGPKVRVCWSCFTERSRQIRKAAKRDKRGK